MAWKEKNRKREKELMKGKKGWKWEEKRLVKEREKKKWDSEREERETEMKGLNKLVVEVIKSYERLFFPSYTFMLLLVFQTSLYLSFLPLFPFSLPLSLHPLPPSTILFECLQIVSCIPFNCQRLSSTVSILSPCSFDQTDLSKSLSSLSFSSFLSTWIHWTQWINRRKTIIYWVETIRDKSLKDLFLGFFHHWLTLIVRKGLDR